MVIPETLDDVYSEEDGMSFPCDRLEGCETALLVFAAGFHGRNDGYWVALAGLRATCIDVDADRLDEMAALYPTDWDFLEANAYTWAETAVGVWDVVSVDCPTGHFERCADLLPVWCGLARRCVVLGTGPNHDTLQVPEGWRLAEVRHRSNYVPGGVHWAVLEAA